MLCEGDGEITGTAVNGGDFAQGFQFNIQMPADLDQFR
jgi:hypothetical protein